MAEARITKIICPSCEGSGKFRSLDCACLWCVGAIRLPIGRARQYADHIYMIAGGGFVAGDHDYEHKVEMEQRAEKIYALTGEAAPWVRSTTRATSGVDRSQHHPLCSVQKGGYCDYDCPRDYTPPGASK